MRKITIDIEQPQIEVNGIVFDLQKSDADILEDALAIARKYESLDTADVEAVVAAIHEVRDYVDAMLGKGALRKIAGGRPVSLVRAIEIMTEIAREAAASYSDHLKDEYA